MWSHDGSWHRLDLAEYSIAFKKSTDPAVMGVVDVVVTLAGQRWEAQPSSPLNKSGSGSNCCAADEGGPLPGNYFDWFDAIIVSKVAPDVVEVVVKEHFEGGEVMMRHPFRTLDH